MLPPYTLECKATQIQRSDNMKKSRNRAEGYVRFNVDDMYAENPTVSLIHMSQVRKEKTGSYAKAWQCVLYSNVWASTCTVPTVWAGPNPEALKGQTAVQGMQRGQECIPV